MTVYPDIDFEKELELRDAINRFGIEKLRKEVIATDKLFKIILLTLIGNHVDNCQVGTTECETCKLWSLAVLLRDDVQNGMKE